MSMTAHITRPRRDGILPAHAIRQMVEEGHVLAAEPLDADQIQPASMDLRLGRRAWRVRASFLPGRGRTVGERLEELALHEIRMEDGAVLETGCVYIIELLESLALPRDVSAAANPKSSTGRIDVFTRIITECGEAFDQVPAGYDGPLFAEVSPRTFPIKARTGMSAQDARAVMVNANRHKRLIAPEEVAAAALWICDDRSGSVNGQCIEIAGGQM